MLEEVTRRIVDVIHPERIILFGSHALGCPSEDSDVNLLIIAFPKTHVLLPLVERCKEVDPGFADLKEAA